MYNEEVAIALSQFVQIAFTGNEQSLRSHAKHLSKCLLHAGDSQTASQIENIIKARKETTVKTARMTQLKQKPIPVDSESRLALADEKEFPEPIDIVLPSTCSNLVNRFLKSITRAEELIKHGIDVPNSILLHGPPGCGKSLLAKHVAHSLSLPLLTARADGLVSSFLGSTAKNIRSLFEHAANRPCVLFLDEFDAIAKMRDDRHEVGELKRVVISLLQNIDAAGPSIIFVAATNHAHLLDPAVWRRFSYSIEVPIPDEVARHEMLRLFSGDWLHDDEMAIIAAITDGMSGAQLKEAIGDVMREAILNGSKQAVFSSAIQMMQNTLNTSSQNNSGSTSIEDAVREAHVRLGKNVSQKKLADTFGISQSKVSRILADK